MATKTTETVDVETTVEKKPKATTKTATTKSKDTTTNNDDVLKALMKEIEDLKKQVGEKKESDGVGQLMDVLSSVTSNNTNQLPQRVKVMSLVHNTLVLSPDTGQPFTFNRFGHTITMRTSQLEEILSVPAYRQQAEDLLFYVCDPLIAEDQELTEFYEIANKDKIEYITSLCDDMCVELLCGLSQGLITSITTAIIEDISNGESYDRNRLVDIKKRLGIDIESKAEELSRVKSNRQ